MSVTDFGAKGDGHTDDYAALQAAAKAICSVGGTLLYPPGVYKIDRYVISGGPNRNNVSNIQFSNCKPFRLSGYGAVIDLKGNFQRTADYHSHYAYSYKNAVIPFDKSQSQSFIVEGFEIRGNANLMTREPEVVESAAHGIRTSDCARYLMRDLRAHHIQTDGIYLGWSNNRPDRQATLVNVVSTNNGRQGLTISQVRGAVIIGSKFRDIGRTEGYYGYHNPAAGVDIEPNFALEPDSETGEIVFANCTFAENLGWQFVVDAGRVSSVYV
jgi:hypothetical protein